MNVTDEFSETHRQTWSLIPWLVNGRATPAERTAVQVHLNQCDECREEFELQQELSNALHREATVEHAPQSSLQKLWWRLDETEPVPGPVPAVPGSRAPRAGRRWAVAPGLAWPALVVQAFVIAILAGAVMMDSVDRRRADYRTVTAQPVPVSRADLHAVFAATMSVAELRALLATSHTIVVEGPSPGGVFALAVAADGGPDPRGRALAQLRADPHVLFADLAGPAGPTRP